MRGDLLKVAKPEPRCLRQRGSVLIPALNDELTPWRRASLMVLT